MRHLQIIDQLYDIGAIKLGSFKLRNGMITPFYIDLRLVVSYPSLLEIISETLWQKISHLKFDKICGVPYTAIPIATILSIKHSISMIVKRKEMKDYGMKQILEGAYQPQERCLIIEDVMVSGDSILETSAALQTAGLSISDIAVIVDREQGGRMALEKQGYTVYSLFTASELFSHLKHQGKVTPHDVEKIKKFIENHQVDF